MHNYSSVYFNFYALWRACWRPAFIHSFIIPQSVSRQVHPQPLPKRVLRSVRSSASSFNFQDPLFSLRSSRSCLHLPPCRPVTSILPSIFPPITYFRRQFLHIARNLQKAVPCNQSVRKLSHYGQVLSFDSKLTL